MQKTFRSNYLVIRDPPASVRLTPRRQGLLQISVVSLEFDPGMNSSLSGFAPLIELFVGDGDLIPDECSRTHCYVGETLPIAVIVEQNASSPGQCSDEVLFAARCILFYVIHTSARLIADIEGPRFPRSSKYALRPWISRHQSRRNRHHQKPSYRSMSAHVCRSHQCLAL